MNEVFRCDHEHQSRAFRNPWARFLLNVSLCILVLGAAMCAQDGGALQIYFVDVEGGQATLFVTPDKESLLIDTGWPGNDGRDADRIVAAAKKAGISKIDYVLITHFHEDHVGGAPQLAAKIPIGTFIDHGENRENTDAPTVQVWQAYQQLLSGGKYQAHNGEARRQVADSRNDQQRWSARTAPYLTLHFLVRAMKMLIARMRSRFPPTRQKIFDHLGLSSHLEN